MATFEAGGLEKSGRETSAAAARTAVQPHAQADAHQRGEAIARRYGGDETLTDIARSYNVSHSTISRLR